VHIIATPLDLFSSEPARCRYGLVLTAGARESTRRREMRKIHRPIRWSVILASISAQPGFYGIWQASLDGTAGLRRDRRQGLRRDHGAENHRSGVVDMFRSYSDNTVFQHQCGLRGPLGRTLCEPPAKGIQRLLPLHSQGPELGFAEVSLPSSTSPSPTSPCLSSAHLSALFAASSCV
jgi:hypothetical protein